MTEKRAEDTSGGLSPERNPILRKPREGWGNLSSDAASKKLKGAKVGQLILPAIRLDAKILLVFFQAFQGCCGLTACAIAVHPIFCCCQTVIIRTGLVGAASPFPDARKLRR